MEPVQRSMKNGGEWLAHVAGTNGQTETTAMFTGYFLYLLACLLDMPWGINVLTFLLKRISKKNALHQAGIRSW